jgi:uncharacterized protein with HEPN domain
MPKNDWVYLGHMLDLCQKATEIIGVKTRETYDDDVTLQFALTHIVQMIGEAADHVSDDFRGKHSEIRWHEIIGMRHRIVHDYMNVDEDVVWSVVQFDLKPLVTILKNIIPPEMQ